MEEEWRECCQWLARVQLIPQDHVLNSASCKMYDLAKSLRDGVLLCKLLFLLDESSIDLGTINQRPQSAQFLCIKNIKKFLHSCSQHFEIREPDLFEPHMLFEFTDFGKVLNTLSKLSKCAKVQLLGIEGFPKNTTHRASSQDAYRVLKEMVNEQSKAEDPSKWNAFEEDPYSFIEEDIYEELVPRCQERSPDKRELCLRELLETEKNYADALKRVLCNFYRPLKEIMGDEDCAVIFFKFRELADIHMHLNRSLHDAKHSATLTIAEVFIGFQEKLLIYGDYCANLSKAQSLLETLMADDCVIRQKIKDCETHMSNRQYQLRDYLVVPLQRILKYHLLLGELLKHTAESNEETSGLKRAYEAMLDVADYVNEVKRDKETLQIIEELQTSITDIPEEFRDLRQMGRLRHDGDIKVECHPDKMKSRLVFLFDKVMIMCKQSKEEKYLYKDAVVLDDCKLENYSVTSGSMARRANGFLLVKNGCKKAYTVITKNEDAKAQWFKAVSQAIENVNPVENVTKNHDFRMKTFDQACIRCDVCHKLLKGCFFQGYECNVCKSVVHKMCLKDTKTCRESPPITPTSALAAANSWPEYWNLQIREYPWWVDKMTRQEANTHLLPCEEGSFLLRWSEKHSQPIVSIKAQSEVKHMRVHKHPEKGYFYFSDARYFPSLVELINFYRQFKLSECFDGLRRTLKKPIYDTAVALFPYIPTGTNQLSLSEGQKIIVISRDGESLGWWRGRLLEKTGYFPKEYVKVENDAIW